MKRGGFVRILLCCIGMLLLCGCAELPEQNAAQGIPADSSEVPALVADMLLQTEESMQLSFSDAAEFDPEAVIHDAAAQHVLARTMLRSVLWSRSGNALTITAQYAKPAVQLRKDKEMLAESVTAWCRNYDTESDDVLVLLAHDALCRRCIYSEISPDRHSAYGAWIGHQAVCDGYAEAFALLMETAGIPVKIVTGTALDGDSPFEPHAWNLVQLAGAWYHIDCTWDDAGDSVSHTYFLCDDTAISATHTWDAKKYPPALGGGYRYEQIVSDMMAKVRTGGCEGTG